MTIVPTLTQRNAFQSRGGWGSVLSNRMTRQVVGNAPLTNPVCDVFMIKALLFIYFSHPTGGGPLDLSPAVRCYDTDMTIDL